MDGMENLTTEETTVENTAEAEVTTETQSAETQEAAEPAEVQEESKPEVDVNAIAAAARRKSEERLKAIDDEYARRFGHLTNPKTGEPIRSQQDYLAALDAQEELNAKEQLRQSGLDPNILDQAIANNPLVRQAQEVMARAERSQTEQRVMADVEALKQLDPSITSIDTIPQEVINFVMANRQRDVSLVEAYKILNYGKMSSGQQAAITQQAINQAKGKSHLNPVNGVATPDDGVEIPASELENWKNVFPGKSMAELKKLYNKTL